MDIEEAISRARETFTVNRVYGDPYERDGVTVIPAAAIGGGGGGGGGEDATKGGKGGGGGFGLSGRPVGAYVIENGAVRWVPAPDATQIATRALIVVAALAFLLLRIGR